ncbi:MAG TPA: c-type cytochrome [Acidimicrobiia bacterium]|nr:c-type cytochrome [Acidimicrobiia bacterium]
MAARSLVLCLTLVLGACGAGGDGPPQQSEDLAADAGCMVCHTDTDTSDAPTLHGIWGTEAELADGRSVTVDEEYVRRSITEPSVDVVAGYGPTMPPVPLQESEVEQLVEWVRSLG